MPGYRQKRRGLGVGSKVGDGKDDGVGTGRGE